MKPLLKAHLMLISGALIGAFNYSISKIIMPHYISPMAVVVFRGMIAIVVFSVLHFLFVKEKLHKKDYPRIGLAAVFGIAVNQVFFYTGLNLTTPINASLMMTMTPIAVLLISSAVLKEKITLPKLLGVFLGTIGTVLLLLHSGRGAFEKLFAGDLMVLTNAVSWACFLVTVKPLMLQYHPLTILKWIFTLGFFLVLPFGYQDFMNTPWHHFTTEAWWALGFVIVFATLLAYYYNSAVLKYVNPSLAGSYIYLQPFLAALIAIAWGKDHFSFEKLVYLIIILSGVYLISFKNSVKKPAASSL
jgi:drug/metabolite transporter (DMT)-like permease